MSDDSSLVDFHSTREYIILHIFFPVGRPIYVPRIASPSNEVIDEYKTKFVVELQQLFDENKATYDRNGAKAKLTVE